MKKKTHVVLTLAVTVTITLGVASFPNTPLEQHKVEAADFNYTQDQQTAGDKTASFTTTKTSIAGEPTPASKPTYADFQTGQMICCGL